MWKETTRLQNIFAKDNRRRKKIDISSEICSESPQVMFYGDFIACFMCTL